MGPKIITPFFIAIIIFFILMTQNMEILNSPKLNIDVHSDFYDEGTSKINLLNTSENRLEYKYTIGKEYQYAYAGINVRENSDSFINLEKYEYLNLSIKSTKSAKLIITFYNYLEGFTDLNKFETYYPLYYEIPVAPEFTKVKIPLKKLKKHQWWINKNNMINQKPDLSSVIYFEINNHPDFPTNVEDFVTIKEFNISRDIVGILISLLITIFLYFIVLWSKVVIQKKYKRSLNVISYKSLDINEDNNKDNKIEQFISEHYMNPELCITMISDSLKLSSKQVSEGINRQYNISFPVYLNLIRINESKRLLKETNKKIIDIAIEVGYNTPVHFNRSFKKQEKLTPREYRKKWENH